MNDRLPRPSASCEGCRIVVLGIEMAGFELQGIGKRIKRFLNAILVDEQDSEVVVGLDKSVILIQAPIFPALIRAVA